MHIINDLLCPTDGPRDFAGLRSPVDCPHFEVHHRLTLNYSRNRDILPSCIVVHYTAGGSAFSTANWCVNHESGVSYHLIIDRDGAVIQLVPFRRRAWHAGVSNFREFSDLNSHSIGIAFANWGLLQKAPDGRLCAWPRGYNETLPTSTPWLRAPHKFRQEEAPDNWPYWEAYTGPQLRSFSLLVKLLADYYPIKWILGHDDCAPGRKVDPGPGFGCLPLHMDAWEKHWLSSAWAW